MDYYKQTIDEIIERANTEVERVHGVEIQKSNIGINLPLFWCENDEGEIIFDTDSIRDIFETFMSELNSYEVKKSS